jgi:hypothetical protein
MIPSFGDWVRLPRVVADGSDQAHAQWGRVAHAFCIEHEFVVIEASFVVGVGPVQARESVGL